MFTRSRVAEQSSVPLELMGNLNILTGGSRRGLCRNLGLSHFDLKLKLRAIFAFGCIFTNEREIQAPPFLHFYFDPKRKKGNI